MKSHINDSVKKVINTQKKIIIRRKNNSLSINNKEIIIKNPNNSKKSNITKKTRLNSTKEAKNNLKKALNSKLKLNITVKTPLNKEKKDNNFKTINSRNLKYFQESITPPRKSKIKIIKKKNNNKSKSIGTISTGSGDNFNYFADSDENNRNISINNFNYNADSHSNKLETILLEENKNNINNFIYETNSKEDNDKNDKEDDNKIMLKCDNYSLITFGNSFSYSNSQKRKNNKEFLYEEKNNKKNFNINVNRKLDNTYIDKLKEENEILRKELKESTEQISFLMHKIQDLKQDTYFINKKPIKKKLIHKSRNISIKINKTKETYEKKIQNKTIINNFKKKQINTNTFVNRDKKYHAKMIECISKIKI